VWYITVKEVDIIEPKKKEFLKTTIGDYTSTRTETVENEKQKNFQYYFFIDFNLYFQA